MKDVPGDTHTLNGFQTKNEEPSVTVRTEKKKGSLLTLGSEVRVAELPRQRKRGEWGGAGRGRVPVARQPKGR